MKSRESARGILWPALAMAALTALAPCALAIQADGVELGTGGAYDGMVRILRGAGGQMMFQDCEVTSAVALTSLTRSVSAATHGGLSGLGNDDHPQYLTGGRHGQDHASADFNSTMPVVADVDGNTTLGAHLNDGDIHLNRTTQTVVSGDWIFSGAPRIWNGVDFSASGGAGQAQLQFHNGMSLLAGNGEMVSITSDSGAATVTVNAGMAPVNYQHWAQNGIPALFVNGSDGRIAAGSNEPASAGFRFKAQSDTMGSRPFWLSSYSQDWPWSFTPLIMSHTMGTERFPQPPTGLISNSFLIFQCHNGANLVTTAYIDAVVAGYTLGEPNLPGSVRIWTRRVGAESPQLRINVDSTGQCGFYSDPDIIPITCGNGAFLSVDGYWTDASNRERKTRVTAMDEKAAWDLLDRIAPVEFEFRKAKTQWRLPDGRLVDSLASEIARKESEIRADAKTRPSDRAQARALAEQFIQTHAETTRTLLQEGTGLKRRGFIAEDLPAELSHGQAGVSAIEIATHGIAALKEAKRRILELEERLKALEQKMNAK